VYLAWAGLVSIIFALITSYGLCSYFGFVVSPLHNFIPFLLLGLGVDDMFVIVQALDYFKRSASHSLSSRNNYVDVDEYQDKDDELNTGNINFVLTASGNRLCNLLVTTVSIGLYILLRLPF
jgi:hypothetical protein